MTPRTLNNQDGIAIGPILFIIAILAIIAAAIAAGSGEFSGSTSAEQNKQNAQALVNYVGQLQNGIDMVLHNGCTDTQINFYNLNDVNPANPNAPSDHSCDLYDPRGGGVAYHNFSALPILDPVKAPAISSTFGISVGQFSENYVNVVTGFGSAPTMMIEMLGLNQNTCAAINKIVNYNPPSFTPLTEYWWGGSQFTGSYINDFSTDLGISTSKQGCVLDGNPSYNDYVYLAVLLARPLP